MLIAPMSDTEMTDWLGQLCPAARVVFDLAAGDGQWAERALALMPQGVLVALEWPDASALSRLARSHPGRVLILEQRLGVTDSPETATLARLVGAFGVPDVVLFDVARIDLDALHAASPAVGALIEAHGTMWLPH